MTKLLSNVILLLVLNTGLVSLGQELNTSIDIGKELSFKVLKNKDGIQSIEDALNSSADFISPQDIVGKTHPDELYWIRLDFENAMINVKPDSVLYLKLNTFDHGHVFYQKNKSFSKSPIGQFDKYTISQKIKFSNYYSFFNFKARDLLENRYLFLSVKRITFNEDIKHWHFTYYNLPVNSYIPPNDFSKNIPFYFFAGFCFLMWFSTLSFFFMLRNPEFLFYPIYILITFLYAAGKKFGIFEYIIADDYLRHWISYSLIFLANLAYLFFFAKYVHSKRDYPFIHFLVRILIWSNVSVLALICFFYATQNIVGFTYIITYISMALCVFAICGATYLLFIAKGPLAYFIAVASLVYCFAQLARIYFAEAEDGLYIESLLFLIIGWTIEMIIFVFGLNYKVHLDLRENFQLQQEAFINKNKALRAQINPHFIFNSLNSIQHLITENNKVSALKYLSKFGRLTRNILESSIESNVMLNEEIKMLEDYLELESFRFDNAFSFKINVDQNLDIEDIEMPFMILQPFVENAIIHGLLPKKEGAKELYINFKKENDVLICEVEDTGVGRQVSVKRQHIYQKERKSRGLEVTKQRLETLSKNPNGIEIIDKVDDNNQSMGTKVVIKIPIETFNSSNTKKRYLD